MYNKKEYWDIFIHFSSLTSSVGLVLMHNYIFLEFSYTMIYMGRAIREYVVAYVELSEKFWHIRVTPNEQETMLNI